MTVEFPRRLLRESSHSWNLVGVAATPGVNAQSVATIIRSDGGGFWSCSMSDVSLSGGNGLKGRDRQKVTTLLWRAVRQICDGGVNSIVVPRNDALFRPWPAGVAQTSGLSIPHDDDTFFDDGSGYYQSVIDITCTAAALRSTALGIAINYAGELQGGESFSIEHPTEGWRMYEISTVEMATETTGVIRFNPPLREAVANGMQLEFDRPRCTMRLASPSSMNLSVVPWTFNSASVDFIECDVDES
jgi:hypothetical protein